MLRVSEAFQSSGIGADENFGTAASSEAMFNGGTDSSGDKQIAKHNLLKITKIFRSTPLWRMLDFHQNSVVKGLEGAFRIHLLTALPCIHGNYWPSS